MRQTRGKPSDWFGEFGHNARKRKDCTRWKVVISFYEKTSIFYPVKSWRIRITTHIRGWERFLSKHGHIVQFLFQPVIMPYGIAAMSAGKVVAPLLSKAELVIQGWDLLFMGSAVLTLVVLLLFAFLYRAPQPEETPLLPEKRHTESVEEPILSSVEQGLMNPRGKRLEEVSGYFDRNKKEKHNQDD